MSIVGGDFFDNYLRDDVTIKEKCQTTTAANGEVMTTRGEIRVPIRIGNTTILQQCRVVDEIRDEVILGNNYLKKANATINFANETIRIESEPPIKGDIKREVTDETKARLVKSITIPSQTVL